MLIGQTSPVWGGREVEEPEGGVEGEGGVALLVEIRWDVTLVHGRTHGRRNVKIELEF